MIAICVSVLYDLPRDRRDDHLPLHAPIARQVNPTLFPPPTLTLIDKSHGMTC